MSEQQTFLGWFDGEGLDEFSINSFTNGSQPVINRITTAISEDLLIVVRTGLISIARILLFSLKAAFSCRIAVIQKQEKYNCRLVEVDPMARIPGRRLHCLAPLPQRAEPLRVA